MHSAPTPLSNALPEDFKRHAQALCRTMAAIHRRGWCDGTGGNFSVVLKPGQGLRLLMAPSGVDKGRVRPADLIVVNAAGAVVNGEGKVSAEMPLHREIVESTGAGAVLHTHSQAATLLSLQALSSTEKGVGKEASPMPPDGSREEREGDDGKGAAHIEIEGMEMLKGLRGIETHEAHIRIPVLANDQNLIRLSEVARPRLAAAPHGILIAGHGLYAWGRELTEAMRHLEILEFLLEQHWRQHLWRALVAGER